MMSKSCGSVSLGRGKASIYGRPHMYVVIRLLTKAATLFAPPRQGVKTILESKETAKRSGVTTTANRQ
jgi:hypothetical protein